MIWFGADRLMCLNILRSLRVIDQKEEDVTAQEDWPSAKITQQHFTTS
jgi:hypothetical protein